MTDPVYEGPHVFVGGRLLADRNGAVLAVGDRVLVRPWGLEAVIVSISGPPGDSAWTATLDRAFGKASAHAFDPRDLILVERAAR